MKVIQVWVGGKPPEYIKNCINSLSRYSELSEITHEVYTDNLDNLSELTNVMKLLIPTNILEVIHNYNFKFISTKVDMIRYLLLNNTNEYVYYIDADCLFIKDPFKDILIQRDTDFFTRESRGSYVTNSVLGVTSRSLIMNNILEESLKVMRKYISKDEPFAKLGPKFITEIVRKMEPWRTPYIQDHKWLYKISYHKMFKFLLSESSEFTKYYDSVVNDNLSVGIHLFKPPTSQDSPTVIDKLNSITKLINIQEVENNITTKEKY